jgi:hypothetical protein
LHCFVAFLFVPAGVLFPLFCRSFVPIVPAPSRFCSRPKSLLSRHFVASPFCF